jgi:23S rRNA (guanosine2251-2'-O)-methyltransferase
MRNKHIGGEKIYIYGKHSLEEAVKNRPDVLQKVFLSEENYKSELSRPLKELKIPISIIKSKKANSFVGKDATHQGVIALVDTQKLILDFEEFISRLTIRKDTALVLFDELTDPQNVGSIIRSAAAFDLAGALLPSHKQSGITGAVVKASAGMVFMLPVVRIGNVNYTIDALKNNGFQIIALDNNRGINLNNFSPTGPVVFVLGNEGFGIRRTTLERADIKLRIPTNPRCESLNVSVASAIVFYSFYNYFKKK